MQSQFRRIPSVNDLLQLPGLAELQRAFSRSQVVTELQAELAVLRKAVADGVTQNVDGLLDKLTGRVQTRLQQATAPKLRSVINATGIILHTNLGRAPMAEEAARAAYEAARNYLNLELDLEDGERSSRQDAIREWVTRLLGCESATVVNNNAAATVIALRALAQSKEVIVSRGQLVEIGGSFRIPDIMRVSGAVLREVGTTNITRIGDYEAAITPNTAVLLRVHCSNYRVVGHTETPTLEEMVLLGRKHNLLVVDDIGSGALVDYRRWGLADEPLAAESLQCGIDLALFSGDKLLGGPQAGILAGRSELIKKIEKDPLMRAFRLDKMTLAALEATLRLYLDPERVYDTVPVLAMLQQTVPQLRERSEAVAARLRELPGVATVTLREDEAYVGGGSLPDQHVPTIVLAIQAKDRSDSDLAARLRTGTCAVMPRIQDGHVLLDLRTVFPHQEDLLVSAVGQAAVPS